MIIAIIVALAVIICDQLLKHWITINLALGATKTLVPGWLSLTHLRNSGAAWSILQGQTWFFYIITAVAAIVLIYLFVTSAKSNLYRLGLALMFAGAIGNFIDRVHLKYVVDMFQLDFINFPIFNIADFSLTIGVILVFIYILLSDQKAKK